MISTDERGKGGEIGCEALLSPYPLLSKAFKFFENSSFRRTKKIVFFIYSIRNSSFTITG